MTSIKSKKLLHFNTFKFYCNSTRYFDAIYSFFKNIHLYHGSILFFYLQIFVCTNQAPGAILHGVAPQVNLLHIGNSRCLIYVTFVTIRNSLLNAILKSVVG